MRAANDNSRQRRGGFLPAGVAPRGFTREQSAEWIGVSASKFDLLVAEGAMPQPKTVGGRVVWDRYRLDIAFDDLPDRQARNDFDDAGDCFGEVPTPRRHRGN